MRGKLIAIEGLDCAGKTSVILPYIQSQVDPEHNKFVADMKTGNISKKIREIFMDPDCVTEKTDWRTIAYLASAARSDMVVQEITPALNAGINVYTDRYVDTSFVYNKKSDTVPVDTILNLSIHLEYPTHIIFAYCSFEEMVKRKQERDDNDQWDIISEDAYNEKLARYKEQIYSRGGTKVFELNTTYGTVKDVQDKIDKILFQI
jgi:dTMP kinase